MLQQRKAFRRKALLYCITDCASDVDFVESFNRRCGTHLRAPIARLTGEQAGDVLGTDPSVEDFEAALFLQYVILTVWPRLQAAMEDGRWRRLKPEAIETSVERSDRERPHTNETASPENRCGDENASVKS